MNQPLDFPLSPAFERRILERPELAKQLGFRPESGSGNDGGMEARITRLEVKMDKIDDRLRGVELGVATLNERVAHLPGKGFIVTIFIGAAAIMAFADKVGPFVTKLIGS